MASYQAGNPPPFGTRTAYQNLCLARLKLQDVFPDDGCRDIPEVLAAFVAVDNAIVTTRRLLNDDNNTPLDN